MTTYDYGFRIYNPSIAKFLSVDPLAHSYPWYTPYQFAGNSPIAAIDLDGLEPKIVTSPQVINNRIYSAEEINLSLQAKYEEVLKKHHLIRDENGRHGLDLEIVRPILEATLESEGKDASLRQYNEFQRNAEQAIQKYDRTFFNSQSHIEYKQQLDAELKERITTRENRRLRELRFLAEENGRTRAYVDIAVGSFGATISTISLFSTGGASSFWSGVGLFYSLESIVGGVRALEALENGIFDESKEYRIVKGFAVEIGGDTGGIVYDVGSFFSSSRDVANVSKISGKKLNDVIRGIAEALHGTLDLGKDEIVDQLNK